MDLDVAFEREVFKVANHVLELPSVLRAQALAESCCDDTALRKAAEMLIRDCEDATSFLESPVVARFLDWMPIADGFFSEEIPKKIAAYRVLSRLGKGGMGEVFRVKHPTSQKEMALKILHNRSDDKRLLARFFTEQRAHGLMNHRNIPAYMDDGWFQGKPFFLMEFVKGQQHIMSYIRQNQLDVNQRLNLFLQLCDGVAHAHRHMIIHRDLKPSNVLVQEEAPGQAVVKILDFGIATELLHTSYLVEAAEARTVPGSIIGTWVYLASEMLDGSKHTASVDTFGLGALLYEMLTGKQPRDGKHMETLSMAECMAYCRQPIVGSQNLALCDFKTGKPERLDRDLVRILAKATEPEPDMRYADVSLLVSDVEAYVSGRPLRTQFTPWFRRMGKHLLRFKWVASTALLLLVLATGLIHREVQTRRLNLEKATLENHVNSLTSVFGDFDQMADAHVRVGRKGIELTLLEIAERVRTLVAQDGQAFAPMMARIARMLENLGLYEQAVTYFGVAAGGLGDSGIALDCERRSIYARFLTGKEDVALLMMEDFQNKVASSSEWNEQVYKAMLDRAVMLRFSNRVEQAEELLQKILTEWQERLTPLDLCRLKVERCRVLTELGRYDEAIAEGLPGLQGLRKELGSHHPKVLDAGSSLANTYNLMGKPEQAAVLGQEVLAVLIEKNGHLHTQTAVAKSALASVMNQRGRYKEAFQLATEAAFVLQHTLGFHDIQTSRTQLIKAQAANATKQYDEAINAYTNVLANEEILTKDLVIYFKSRHGMANVYFKQGQIEKSKEILEESLREPLLEDDDSLVKIKIYLHATLAEVYLSEGRYDETILIIDKISNDLSLAFSQAGSINGVFLIFEGVARYHIKEEDQARILLRSGLEILKNSYPQYRKLALDYLKKTKER